MKLEHAFTPRPEADTYHSCTPLIDSLALIDDIFSIDAMISFSESDFVGKYYRQSIPGYSRMYNPWQCMHVALQGDGVSEEDGYFFQADAAAMLIPGRPGARVLELGCGLGANIRYMAENHPDVEFVGLDLIKEHVARARKSGKAQSNASFVCASFDAPPDTIGSFDVIFAVEALCYAQSLDTIARNALRLLRPGGHLVLFDAHRKTHFESLPEPVSVATRLYEIATAVSNGFHTVGTWETAFKAAGFKGVVTEDMTSLTLQGLTKLHRRSLKAYVDPKWRFALKVMPQLFARNTVAGLLGYHVCFGDGDQPDPANGAVAYQKIVACRP